MVKQETARVNTDILGISELIWTNFNSDDRYVYYCGQEWENLIKMTSISTNVGENPLEEME